MKKLILLLIFLSGCANPPITIPIKQEYIRNEFKPSLKNKYAILISSRLFDAQSQEIEDPYIKTDLDQMRRLLTNKNYDVYQPDILQTSVAGLWKLIENIIVHSNDKTKLFILYSGEGDSTGLRTIGQWVTSNRLLIPPRVTITPSMLFTYLKAVKGSKAVLINACESGVFPNAIDRFKGVVIAACDKGHATTPYEWWGTTAIVAAFLRLYEDDPSKIIDLAEADIGAAGGWWYNFMHRVMFAHPKLKLSYDPVIYRGSSFKF